MPAREPDGGVGSPSALGVSPENGAARNRDALVEALSGSGRRVTLPPGDYPIDNSGEDIVVRGFGGEVTMEPGARLVFTDGARRGLTFEGGTGAVFRGLRTAFREAPARRVASEECVAFAGTTDTKVYEAEIDGSAAAGLLFEECVRPTVDGAVVRNTGADGVHLANCQDARINAVVTENTGDDGVAFLNYADGEDYSGGLATDITVRGSASRGIAVVGQRNVTVKNFLVDGTACSGLYCASESSYGTRTPSDVVFEGGTVDRPGSLQGCATGSHGIQYDQIDSVAFKDVKVNSPAVRGVSGSTSEGSVRLEGIEVRDASETGFDLTGGTYHLEDLTCRDVGGIGLSVRRATLLQYGKLLSVNASKKSTLHRAFSFGHNEKVEGRELHVVDDQTPATGYEVSTDGEQEGSLGVVYGTVSSGTLEIRNLSDLAFEKGSREAS